MSTRETYAASISKLAASLNGTIYIQVGDEWVKADTPFKVHSPLGELPTIVIDLTGGLGLKVTPDDLMRYVDNSHGDIPSTACDSVIDDILNTINTRKILMPKVKE